MFRPHYMNFPFPSYKSYPSSSFNPAYTLQSQVANVPLNEKHMISSNNSTYNNSQENDRSFDKKNKSNKYADDYLFDLFGLKIYNDDILLVSLIYFLYSEGVKDDGLFIVLILLLLS